MYFYAFYTFFAYGFKCKFCAIFATLLPPIYIKNNPLPSRFYHAHICRFLSIITFYASKPHHKPPLLHFLRIFPKFSPFAFRHRLSMRISFVFYAKFVPFPDFRPKFLYIFLLINIKVFLMFFNPFLPLFYFLMRNIRIFHNCGFAAISLLRKQKYHSHLVRISLRRRRNITHISPVNPPKTSACRTPKCLYSLSATQTQTSGLTRLPQQALLCTVFQNISQSGKRSTKSSPKRT